MNPKVILFDLDGVLIDTDLIHFVALNKALGEHNFEITEDEHFSTYRGRPTKTKLHMLHKQKALSEDLYEKIYKKKQQYTVESIRGNCEKDPEKKIMFHNLKQDGWKIGICSNAIRQSVELMVEVLELTEYVDVMLSNQDVKRSKPAPDMYIKAAKILGANILDCIIVEDSKVGIQSALASGGHLCYTPNPHETVERVSKFMEEYMQERTINVVLPLCGEGNRFKRVGYTVKKPMIEVMGKTLLEWSLSCLPTKNLHLIFVYRDHDFVSELQRLGSRYEKFSLVHVDELPQGATMSVLKAEKLINNDTELIVMNSDQFCEWNFHDFLRDIQDRDLDGSIPCFTDTHPKWSFAELDKDDFLKRTAEKQPISDNATIGIYYFKKGSDFVRAAHAMIEAEDTYNNEYYNCPVYNYLTKGKKAGIYLVDKMYGLGTPEDLIHFVDQYRERA